MMVGRLSEVLPHRQNPLLMPFLATPLSGMANILSRSVTLDLLCHSDSCIDESHPKTCLHT